MVSKDMIANLWKKKLCSIGIMVNTVSLGRVNQFGEEASPAPHPPWINPCRLLS